MNNNRYRCVLTGTCPPPLNNPNIGISNGATLTVFPVPTVTVTPNSMCGNVPGTCNSITASGANTYTWTPVTGLFLDCTQTIPYVAGTNAATVYPFPVVNTVYTVTGTTTATGCSNTATVAVNYTPAPPIVNPNPVTMCAGDPAVLLTITSSLQPSPFTTTYTYAGPAIPIVDNNPAGSITPLAVPLPTTAAITNMQVAITATHTWDGDVVFVLKAPNGKILNLDYFLSGTGGTGATTGFNNTRFSSASSTAMSTGVNPYGGTYKADAQMVPIAGFGATGPTGNLANTALWSDLYSTPNGNWSLGAYDGFGGDFGSITAWSLTFDYLYGPTAAGIWTPNGAGNGLYTDPAATLLYNGAPANQVYTRPAATTTYSVTVSTPVTPATFTNGTSGFTPGNANYTISFNVRNNNAFPITLTGVDGQTFFAGAANVQAWYKASAINGPPGAYTNANGWFQFGAAAITGTTAVQTFVTGTTLVIPANSTYGIMLQAADGAGGFDLAYATIAAGTYTFTQGNVDIVTGTNIGYGGVAIPGAPTFTPRGFQGNIRYTLNDPSLFSCTSGPRTVLVTVNTPVTITAQPVNAVVCTDKVTSFSIAVTGTSPNYQWQESTNGGNSFASITNGGVYSGATTNTLTITNPPTSMNGYIYRCAVAGAPPCGTVFSAQRTLTVNPLPTVTISASPYRALFPGLRTTLSSTSTPVAATYTWLRNGAALIATSLGIVSGINTGSLVVDVDGFGDYRLRVTDVNGCTNTSNTITISDSTSGRVFIYPNPNSGQFQVRYNPTHNNVTPRGINVWNSRGRRILTQNYPLGQPYARMNVNLTNMGSGVYWIEVVDVNGDRLAVGRVEILR